MKVGRTAIHYVRADCAEVCVVVTQTHAVLLYVVSLTAACSSEGEAMSEGVSSNIGREGGRAGGREGGRDMKICRTES